jgi:hypothetical protein
MTTNHSEFICERAEAVVVHHAMNHGTALIKNLAGDNALPDWLAINQFKIIYNAVLSLEKEGRPVHPSLVYSELQKSGELEGVKSQFETAEYPSGIVVDAVVQQELISIQRAYVARSHNEIVEKAAREKWTPYETIEKLAPIVAVYQTGRGKSLLDGIQVFDASTLIDRPIDEGQTLLGNRFLCRGGGMVLVGPSGVGKSTITLGFAASWAAGREVLGIKPLRPLKTLIIQAENDEGDVIEQIRGAFGADREGLQNLHICQISHLVGEELIMTLDALLKRFKPDLVILDCLHAYLGDDAKESKALGIFLRQLLNPVIKRYEVGVIIVHHTPKTTNQDRTKWNPTDYQYAAAGSAEIANWTRAMLVLEGTDLNGVFRLVAAKRGGRIGGELWRDGWIPIRHTEKTDVEEPQLKWEIADDIDLATIQRATRDKKAAKQSYQCTAGDFIAQLPEAGNGRLSCYSSGTLQSILKQKKYCSKDSFAGLKAIYASDGIIKILKEGTKEWVGRPDDIDQMERELKS